MQYKQKTDAELVVLLTLNDEEAFSELYVRYKSKLQYFCFHFLKVESEACDIVQEVFIRIWESPLTDPLLHWNTPSEALPLMPGARNVPHHFLSCFRLQDMSDGKYF